MDVAVGLVWAVFWLGWLASALGAKPTVKRRRRARPIALITILGASVVIRILRPSGPNDLVIYSPIVRAMGAVIVGCGLATAVWARVVLGRNWGMPMTEKNQPELVSAGPYRLVRHPIYSGILLATVGTALVVGLDWLVVAVVMCAYFGYSAVVEERMLTEQFPEAYPRYRARTKMLIPFLL